MTQLDLPWSSQPAKLSTRYVRRECQKCQKPFWPRRVDVARGHGKYCGRDCANRAIGDNQRGKPRPGGNPRYQVGPANPNWKGGVSKDHMRYKRRFTRKSPEKVLAQRRLQYAVLSGKITRPDACERCGSGFRVAGHHDDYTKPLEVTWLCQPCHNRHHAWLKAQGKEEMAV